MNDTKIVSGKNFAWKPNPIAENFKKYWKKFKFVNFVLSFLWIYGFGDVFGSCSQD